MQNESDSCTEKIHRIIKESIQAMAEIVEVRDPYTAAHQHNVARLSVELGETMGLSEWQILGIKHAATVHDIGKLHVPSEILSKPGRLSSTEFDLIKLHSQIGYKILKSIEFPWPIAQIVLQHHERMNGSGYPDGLFNDDILLEARILSVADVIEAMSTDRPYRPAIGIGAALEEIVKNKSILYDNRVVDACLSLFAKKGFAFSEQIRFASLVPV
jgi:HD-GYP domain-containing protein (c-di-GMP phosphodiesterase class II)